MVGVWLSLIQVIRTRVPSSMVLPSTGTSLSSVSNCRVDTLPKSLDLQIEYHNGSVQIPVVRTTSWDCELSSHYKVVVSLLQTGSVFTMKQSENESKIIIHLYVSY